MLEKLYEKSKIWFAVLWIAAYCVLMSVGDVVSAAVGTEKIISLPMGFLLSAVLFGFLKRKGLLGTYGFRCSEASGKAMLYYIPLVALLTANLWFGVNLKLGAVQTILYILTMFCVGFLEEVIFRGLLFGAMYEEHPRSAVIVSAVTFGMGHIINLVNGSGAQLVPNLLQVIYATAAGWMFVMIYCRSKSLIACIVTHGLFNALSVFAADIRTMPEQILSCVLITLLTGAYGLYLAGTMKHEEKKNT